MIGCLPCCMEFQIAGCRGLIPLLGEFEGATPPQGFEGFKAFTPLRGHMKAHKSLPSASRRRSAGPRRGVYLSITFSPVIPTF
jgi:hypothetical protein